MTESSKQPRRAARGVYQACRLASAVLCLMSLLLLGRPPARADALTIGDKGAQVDQLKQRLYELKYITSGKFASNYNQTTAERVADFQRINGLAPTGTVDETTWETLFADTARSAWRSPILTDLNASCFTVPALPEDYPTGLTADGFLPDGTEPYIHNGRDEGFWCYLSQDIHIEIRRFYESVTPLTWFETDIRLTGGQRLRSLMDPTAKKLRERDPRVIATDYGAILALSDDFFGFRKSRGVKAAGVIIRDGVIINEKTLKSGRASLPNMDVLALFRDGSMRTFQSTEHSAQEYLDMGVIDTWAFGPILLRGGDIDARVLETSKYYRYHEPRNAIGMIAPGHYLAVSVLGRQKTSAGVRPVWLAQRMADLGCTEALNLDGGNSVAVVFMGDMINKSEGANLNFMKGIRTLSSMIGAGFTEK